jgi:hypothetical protein
MKLYIYMSLSKPSQVYKSIYRLILEHIIAVTNGSFIIHTKFNGAELSRVHEWLVSLIVIRQLERKESIASKLK